MPSLPSHPCRSSLSPKARREPQTARPHGKVADQIPNQASQLYDRRDEGEKGVSKLHVIFS
jgi:hypothetical protein